MLTATSHSPSLLSSASHLSQICEQRETINSDNYVADLGLARDSTVGADDPTSTDRMSLMAVEADRGRGWIADRLLIDFGFYEPCQVQKLFTARGSTCSEFIYLLRLDHAAHLLHRRASLETSQPLSEIAYACGFRDYTHFARRFRHRFGYPPGGRAEEETVRAGTGERASRAHDVRPPAG